MDPVVGIGLAASVVQLVDFSIKAAKTCQTIYQQGSTSDHRDADYTASHLADLTSSLQQSLNDTGTQSAALSREEKELKDLACKCEDCANKLQRKLRKLQAQPQASALEVARKAFRSIRKSDSIVNLQEKLDRYRRILETALLSRLSQRFDAQSLITSERFAKLDQSLKHVVTCLASSQTSLETLVKQESEQIRQHINAQVAQLKQLHINECLYQEVTRSLFFPEISSRQEQVMTEFDGIENSYEWIFDEPSTIENQSEKPQQQQPHWANFPEWLRSGSKVYWINGKAGSGKSTLMHFICNYERKEELLKQWSAERRLLTPTFFFWNAGVRQQKTVDGLLRSLIYQILTECRELIACFKNEPLHTWNEKRLLSSLFTLLTQTQVPVAICVFIDGLDEFDGRYNSVVETIKSITNQNHVKICLSSRPLLDFEKVFAGMPSLRLQDLTYGSILAYANAQLFDLIEGRISYGEHDRERARSLRHKIVRRAEGVFLWAVIAIRDLRDGLQDIVNLHELALAIDGLPAGVENLYMQMLNRIKPAYRREAVRLLQIVLFQSERGGSLDLYRLYFIDIQRVAGDQPLGYKRVDTIALVEACQALKTRVLSHTLGLLDVTPARADKHRYLRRDHDEILLTEVQFHHRTVKEFLLHNTAAKSFVAATGSMEEHLRLCIARGVLAHLIHLSQDNDGEYDYYYSIAGAFEQVAIVERLVGAAQSNLMRSLHDYPFAQEGLVIVDGHMPYGFRCYPSYIIYGPCNRFDLIGMAADSGMLRYVCEVLDLPTVESQSSRTSLLGFQQSRSIDKAAVANLAWVTPLERGPHPSGYRPWLSQCLKWYVQEADQTEAGVDCNTLAETYLLACCVPRASDPNLADTLTLLRILLQAGANPMVKVVAAEKVSDPEEDLRDQEFFWANWLTFLYMLSRDHLAQDSSRESGSGPTCFQFVDRRVTLDEIFDMTKTLLAQGANINFDMDSLSFTSRRGSSLKRYDLQHNELDLEVSSTEMFWLEECFNGYPEFCEFAAAVKPPVKRPRRKIVSIIYDTRNPKRYGKPDNRARAYPDSEESEMLWPFIEKWEETGHHSDLDLLRSAMRRVWRAHNPDIRLKEDSNEEDSNEEDSDEGDLDEGESDEGESVEGELHEGESHDGELEEGESHEEESDEVESVEE
ncbi:MAG: hypothetical protein Q9201_004529 [Fulgogasparrea decipioides]